MKIPGIVCMLNRDTNTSTFVFPQTVQDRTYPVERRDYITTRVTTPWIFSGGRE
jgi:hypothetical protein